ncbi:glycerate kinase [Oleomonas cavernae]|uniref:Glycerate kinase n=1 Tax=Oleomonas cavernae TaxID=2320859 RepID=A0A418WTW1_9PROT|nr:glycerate kinase [Oleomonas cavernae]RJF94704.1 glycerate kinase [Oleomonas cavernae]
MTGDKEILRGLFDAALAAALPDGRFAGRLPPPPRGRTIVLGAGKGAARMAQAFEAAWEYPCEGLVVTRYGHGAATRSIEVVEASHPVPDAAGERAAARILALAAGAGADDLVICLISGGASALLALPAHGITLETKRRINKALLKSGAAIDEMNAVRKAMSAIKGGRLLAAAQPARCITYLISDVPGDEPAIIGSGPTIPDATPVEAALSILARHRIEVEPALATAIRANTLPQVLPGEIHMLATPKMALDAAAAHARSLGFTPLILGDAIEGIATEVATVMAGIAQSAARHGAPVARPAVLLSGGETTVMVKGHGRGGRNAEFLLALALRLDGLAGVSAIACDTDGIDGSQDNAGAWIGQDILAQARSRGLDARAFLDNNDAYSFFAALDRLVVTGPTLTNVNDFRAILIR